LDIGIDSFLSKPFFQLISFFLIKVTKEDLDYVKSQQNLVNQYKIDLDEGLDLHDKIKIFLFLKFFFTVFNKNELVYLCTGDKPKRRFLFGLSKGEIL
jgi:hypothetical protein